MHFSKSFIAIAFVLIGGFTPSAHASYIQADLIDTTANAALGQHIVLAGRGLEAGKTWLMAGHTQALVFKNRSQHGTIRLFAALDPIKQSNYLDTLKAWGYRNVRVFNEDFTADELIARLTEVKLVASLDFIGHDGAFLGLALEDEGSDHRFYRVNVDRMAGKVHFSKDAFIRLLGCNTGWFLAPYMAKVLGVPTAGTLTSADVELLYNNAWYYDENSTHPRGVNAEKENRISYPTPVSCVSGGGCVRLKAIAASYLGQHGTYTGALPFMKFFCGTVASQDCFRRMALSAEYAVSVNSMPLTGPNAEISEPGNFAATLADLFCAPSLNDAKQQACLNEVTAIIEGRATLPRTFSLLPPGIPQLTCDFQKCQFKVGKDDKGQNVLLSTGAGSSTTLVDELEAYKVGFSLLTH